MEKLIIHKRELGGGDNNTEGRTNILHIKTNIPLLVLKASVANVLKKTIMFRL